MANTYTYTGPGTRWTVGNPTAKDLLDIARVNVDHLHEALNVIMDTDNPELGLGNITMPDDGWIGLGAAAGRIVYNATPTPDTLTIEAAALHINMASGDPTITFDIGGTNEWTLGSDDSDSDYFKISKGGTIGGTSGDYHFYDGWGLAIIAPENSSARLYLAADDADDATDAYRLEVGTAGEFVIDARTARVGAMPDNGGTWTERLRIDSSGNVGLGTTSLGEKMNIAGNIELDVATGDPSIIFDTQGANKFSIGVDDSDNDSFKISEGGTIGAGGTLQDIVVFAGSSGLAIVAAEASSARFFMAGDNGDDAIDVWRLDGGSAGLKFQHRTATSDPLPDNSGTYVSRLVLDAAGSVQIGTAALATSATDGFLYISSMAGAPSGTPTDHANLSAIVHDTTNNRIYLYDHVSGAWAYAALT